MFVGGGGGGGGQTPHDGFELSNFSGSLLNIQSLSHGL